MKKYLSFLLPGLLVFAVSNKALSQQSMLIVENSDTRPVPVKIMNPAAPGQNIVPFTQLSVEASGATKVTIIAASNETRVVEYILAHGTSATSIKISLVNREFYVFMPPALVSIPSTTPPPPTKTINTYSGAVNIVIKGGETCVFEINGSDTRSILLSGYTIIK